MKHKQDSASYTFRYACDVCDTRPVLKELGMCAVCTFGEADSMWEWLWDGVVKAEKQAAEQWLRLQFKEMRDAGLMDKKGNIDPISGMLMHLDQPTLDKIEEIL